MENQINTILSTEPVLSETGSFSYEKDLVSTEKTETITHNEPKRNQNRVYKLRKPFVFEDREINELDLDFDSLTGADLEDAASVLNSLQQQMVTETCKPYLAAIVAKAAGQPMEIMKYMYAKDYTALTMEAQGFLLG